MNVVQVSWNDPISQENSADTQRTNVAVSELIHGCEDAVRDHYFKDPAACRVARWAGSDRRQPYARSTRCFVIAAVRTSNEGALGDHWVAAPIPVAAAAQGDGV